MSAGTKAVIVGVAGVVGGLLLAVAVFALARSGNAEIKLGDEEFEVGDTETLADDIVENDRPLIFSDPSGGDRDIWVQHLGDDPAEGWTAFDVQIPDEADCLVDWDAEEGLFVSTCDDAVTFPADGEGLRQYETRVEDDDLIVDLRT